MNKAEQAGCPRSCIDCGAVACDDKKHSDAFPPSCLSGQEQREVLEEAVALYELPENHAAMKAAAEVEFEHYCRYTRVEEVMAFARKLGFHRLGIATCIGLLRESRTLAKILRANGFEVYGAGCKAGMVNKTDLGIDPACNEVGAHACNPIFQAKLLNAAGTQLNIVVGLCVGHDSLFYKSADALVTTLVAKDRVLGHNPAAALYTAESYYRKKLLEKED